MFPTEGRRVGIDATPLDGGHGIRGIGRYLDGVLRAVGAEEPAWARDRLGLLLAAGQTAPIETVTWQTRRSPFRPQDLDVFVALVADRVAIRGSRPRAWQHTDPAIPWSPIAIDRTVVTVYDLIPLSEPSVMNRIRPHRRLVYRRYLDLVRHARGVIAISETTAAELVVRLGVARDKIQVVPPWVAPLSPARAISSDEGARLRLLFVGVPDPHKRPELAIATLAELTRRGIDAELAFIGVHPQRDRTGLRERIEIDGLEQRVRFLDRIDDGELARRYSAATLLATSRVEGFGLPPVEAILAGGRVVATPSPAYRETLDGIVPFARDETAEALADAVLSAVDSPPTDTARAVLAQRFSRASAGHALVAAHQHFFPA